MLNSAPPGRGALVVAHPSHELRVHGWLSSARPLVCVLTDGSGRAGNPRLASTARVLADAEARRGPVFGRLTDLEAYAALLERRTELFTGIAREIAAELVREGVDYVVGDAAEGFNSVHDACRLMVSAAAEMASRDAGRPIADYDFLVVGPPDECPPDRRERSARLQLDQQAVSAKLAAARSYSAELSAEIDGALAGASLAAGGRLSDSELVARVYADLGGTGSRPELAAQVNSMLAGARVESFRTEWLRPTDFRRVVSPEAPVPFFERYGELLVQSGAYRQVIRMREHLLPVADALRDAVAAG